MHGPRDIKHNKYGLYGNQISFITWGPFTKWIDLNPGMDK